MSDNNISGFEVIRTVLPGAQVVFLSRGNLPEMCIGPD